jgi:hypothetical protein
MVAQRPFSSPVGDALMLDKVVRHQGMDSFFLDGEWTVNLL